jgi:hypothetical protein
MTLALLRFEKNAKRMKARGNARMNGEMWRKFWYRTTLFVNMVHKQLMLSSKAPEEYIKAKFAMFADGDFDDELDAYLTTQPEGFNYKSITLYNPHMMDGVSIASMSTDVVCDAHVAADKAMRAKFEECDLKIKADLSAWTKFVAASTNDEKMNEVATILHQRSEEAKGLSLITKFMDQDVKVVTARDKETTKMTLSMASHLNSL